MAGSETQNARRFISSGSPRVIFGAGMSALVPSEFRGQGKVLLVCTAGRRELADQVARRLGGQAAGTFDRAEPHVPLAVAKAAREMANELQVKWVLACGGGTPIGLAKAVALEVDVKVGAIPTTYAGSEMTDIWGITEGGQKRTGRDERVRPALVVYDPELSVSFPVAASYTSLFNALAHAAEALYAEDGTDEVREIAGEACSAIVRSIRGLSLDGADMAARTDALYGAHLAASCLARASMGLHHKLCHVFGGMLGTPHAETHTVLLPHVLAYNAPAAAQALRTLAHQLGADDAPLFLHKLARSIGAPTSLSGLGVAERDLDRVVAEVLAKPYANPRAAEASSLRALLTDAFEGRVPRGIQA